MGYFTAKSWMTGGSVRDGWDEYLRTKWEVLPAYYKVWTPATFAILFFVPPHFRVLVLSAISLFWLVILSFKVPMVDANEHKSEIESSTTTHTITEPFTELPEQALSSRPE